MLLDSLECASRSSRIEIVRRRGLQILLLLPLTACLVGCGRDSGPKRVIVSGTITHNGKPIPSGEIRFMPFSTSSSPVSGAIITGGKYKAEGHGGVPVGTHNVQIAAYRADPNVRSPMVRGIPQQQYLPRRYNIDSQLEISIEPGSPEITKDFDLTD